MADDKQLHDDLSYVRTVVERAEDPKNPASIYFLWAVISFFGYAIIDVSPEKTGPYWMIAGPVGGILSGVLGSRANRAAGHYSKREASADFLHWMALFAGILLLIPMVTTGALSVQELPRIILLLVTLSYFTAGVHQDRRLIPVALAMAAAYLLTVLARDLPWLWTITGAILAVSLAGAGIVAAARSKRTT